MRKHHTPQAPGTGPVSYTAAKLAASVGSGTQTKAQVDAFNEKIAPRKLDRLMFFAGFEGEVLRTEFTKLMEETGMEEMVLAWQPSNNSATVSFTKEIIEGKKDAFIKAAFEAMKAWGKPIFLRLAHEFNGNWYPYGMQFGTKTEATGTNKKGETAAEFKEWWQRVYNICVEVVASNVKFVWNVNSWGGAAEQDPATYYPGSAYVDYIGIDNYMKNGSPPRLPTEMFKTYYESIAVYAATKPLFVCETGCCPTGEDSEGKTVKSAWFTQLAYMLTHGVPAVHVGYWNRSGGGGPDYTIDTSGTDIPAREAFKTTVNNPNFV